MSMQGNLPINRPSANDAPELIVKPSPDDTRNLRNIFGAFATGVTVVTTGSEAKPHGMTVNSFSSVSLDPALILWSVARDSARCALFEQAGHFTVNVLSSYQEAIAMSFAGKSQPFDTLPWSQGQHQSPVLSGCVATFECQAHACYAGGDHTIIVGKVLQATLNAGEPLIFHKGKFGLLAGV